MSYCGHYQSTGAWPCTVLREESDVSEEWVNHHLWKTLVRADRLVQSAQRAAAAGATADQLAEYLIEIGLVLEGGDDAEESAGNGEDPALDPGAPATPGLPGSEDE